MASSHPVANLGIQDSVLNRQPSILNCDESRYHKPLRLWLLVPETVKPSSLSLLDPLGYLRISFPIS